MTLYPKPSVHPLLLLRHQHPERKKRPGQPGYPAPLWSVPGKIQANGLMGNNSDVNYNIYIYMAFSLAGNMIPLFGSVFGLTFGVI